MTDIEDLLDSQVARHKEKAEKVAKNIIRSSLKQRQKAEKQAKQKAQKGKKPKGGRGKKAAPSSDDAKSIAPGSDQEEQDINEIAGRIIQRAEAEQLKVDQVLEQQLAKISKPTYIPLTKLTSPDEKQTCSARGLLMQAALKEAQELEAAQKKSKAAADNKRELSKQPPKIGILACLEKFEKSREQAGGIPRAKGKAKAKVRSAKDKDDKELATEGVMKLGKHLLK